MPSTSLGARLKDLRRSRALTQDAVAQALGIKRASVTQWETDRHLPSPDNIAKLDELYGALGALVAHAEGARSGDAGPATRNRALQDVFGDVADALVGALRTKGEVIGWSHNLVEDRPTPLSSAFAIRALQLLDDARVDLHAVGEAILRRRRSDGLWSNRQALDGRPEATATIVSTLARMGMLSDIPTALAQLRGSLGEFSRSRPYVLAVVLESVLDIQPGHPFVEELVEALLGARMRHGDQLIWAANAAARADLVEPSLPHTARAVAVLRTLRSSDPTVVEAIDGAVDWIVHQATHDEGTIERLEPEPGTSGARILIHHFSATWCVRALIGRDDVPPHRLARSVNAVWEDFDSAREHLWCWRSDVTFPSWMTLDAVSALRAAAMTTFPTPLSPKRESSRAHAADAGDL